MSIALESTLSLVSFFEEEKLAWLILNDVALLEKDNWVFHDGQ